jgi:PPM family protein phosphatase
MDPSAPPSQLQFDLGHATHTGLLRPQNEDSFCAVALSTNRKSLRHEPVLLAVADGMGGEEAGEVASSLAIQHLIDRTRRLFSTQASPDENWVHETVAAINEAVSGEASRRGHMMGTTLVFSVIHNSRAYLANVGDSRIYFWRPGMTELSRLVKDHSLVQMLVDEGIIADDDRYVHPRRNYITRSLGDPNTGVSDENPAVALEPGDWLLLCSDGLWEMVRDDAIFSVVSSAGDAQSACEALVALANLNGGEDNISVVAARVI